MDDYPPHHPHIHPSSLCWSILNDFISNCNIHINSNQLEQTPSLAELNLDGCSKGRVKAVLLEPSQIVWQHWPVYKS